MSNDPKSNSNAANIKANNDSSTRSQRIKSLLYNHSRVLDLATWDSNAIIEWIFGEIGVVYKPKLDGGGTFMAEWFVELLNSRYPDRVFKNTFEWCSGPGYIGFALLEAGLTENLVLADISEEAMECVKQTVDNNPKIKDRVRYYVSDNMKSIPKSEQFDLVVGNPPWYYSPIPRRIGLIREMAKLAEQGIADSEILLSNLRGNDLEWRIHQSFYQHIGDYLLPGAKLVVLEDDPLTQVLTSSWRDVPYPVDVRPRPPIVDFAHYIEAGGLRFCELLRTPMPDSQRKGMTDVWFVVSEKAEVVTGFRN